MENSVVIMVKGSQIVSAPVKFADDAELRVEVSKTDLFEDLDLQAVPLSNKETLLSDLIRELAMSYLKDKCEQSEYGRELLDEMELNDEFNDDLEEMLNKRWQLEDLKNVESDLDDLFDNYKDILGMKYFEVNAEVTTTAPIRVMVKAKSREDAEDFVRNMDYYDLIEHIDDCNIQDVCDINADEQSYDESEDYYEA